MLRNDPAHDEAPLLPFDPHHAGCPRGWRDVIAEVLLALAVALIAATGIDPLMLTVSQLLGAQAPRYDPVVWLLIAVPCIVAALVGTAIARGLGVADTRGFDWIELIIQIVLAASASPSPPTPTADAASAAKGLPMIDTLILGAG